MKVNGITGNSKFNALAMSCLFILSGCVVVPSELGNSASVAEESTNNAQKIKNNNTPEQSNTYIAIHSKNLLKEQTHHSILAFADRYMERIAQVSDELISSEITAMDREFIQSMRVAYVTSAIAIATEAEPLNQLLNMYVMVSLQLSVWEDTKDPFLLKYKSKISDTLRTLKESISAITSKALTPKDIELLDQVINNWRAKNPNQSYVAFIRFDDFESSSEKKKLLDSISRKGVFASIKSAEQDLHKIQKLSERALFLANRFPILIRWQSELFVYRLASTDEFNNLQEDMHGLRNSIENVSNTFASLPAEIEKQRAQLISEVSQEIHQQRKDTLQQLDLIITSQRKAIFADLENNSDSLIEILRTLSISANSLENMTRSIEKIMSMNQSTASESSSFNTEDIRNILNDSNLLTENLQKILEFVAAKEIIHEQGIQVAEETFDRLLQRLFIVILSLVTITIAMITISIIIVKKTNKP